MGRTTTLLVALAAALAFSACDPTVGRSGYQGPRGAPRLNVIGHSIPTSARAELGISLSSTRQVAFDTANGRTIPQASSSIDWVITEGSKAVVVDLGENELGTGASQAHLRRQARTVLDRLATVPCLVWVDIADGATPFYRPDWRTQAESFNAWIQTEVDRRANAHAAGWSDWSRPHGSWFLPDGLHLTNGGQRAYAAFVAAEVERFCGGPATTTPIDSEVAVAR